jgi:hypothetical protein
MKPGADRGRLPPEPIARSDIAEVCATKATALGTTLLIASVAVLFAGWGIMQWNSD